MTVLVTTAGCATIVTLQEDGRNKIYSGTLRHFDLACAHATCLDFPFSLVADTVILPYTIPLTIYNVASGSDAKQKPADNADDAK